MRTAFLAGVLLVAATTTGAEPRWRLLPLVENGRVAAGWRHVGHGGFDVAEGALRTRGDAGGLGVLVYEKEKFGNCRIRVVFRSDDAKDNSGVHIRIADGVFDAPPAPAAARGEDGDLTEAGAEAMRQASADHLGPWYAVHRGYEIQILDDGDSYHRTGAIYSLAPAELAPEKKPTEWKTMVVTLDGELVTIEIDGRRYTTFDPAGPLPERKQWYEPEREPKRPAVGYFGLQNHDPGDVVYFKEVSVAPLEEQP